MRLQPQRLTIAPAAVGCKPMLCRTPVDMFHDVTRTIQLSFSSTDPTGASSPEYGSAVLAGTYGEQFPAGSLHKNPIAVSGSFRLTRVSLTARLNQ